MIWDSWQSGTAHCSSSPESCCSGLHSVTTKYLPPLPSDLFCPQLSVKWESPCLQTNKPFNHPLSLHTFCQRWDTCDPLEAEFLFATASSQIVLKSSTWWVITSSFPDLLQITPHAAGKIQFQIPTFWFGLALSLCLWGFVLILSMPVFFRHTAAEVKWC